MVSDQRLTSDIYLSTRSHVHRYACHDENEIRLEFNRMRCARQ